MSTIRQTIESNLSPQYHSYADGVIEALDQREAAIVEGLRSYAESRGLAQHEVDNLFIGVGLMEPAPEPEPEETLALEADAPSEGVLADILATIKRQGERIEQLVTAAARHGVRV